ncbi:MAG: PocR ligand-binding domain-containing protein [Candidatus Omnitrophota bacterium]
MAENRPHHWLSLRDIIDLEAWQKIQNNFSAVTGVSLRTVDASGNPITQPSNLPRLCSESLLKCAKTCLPTFLGGKGVVDKNLSFSCPEGMHNFLAPLRVGANDSAMGYLLIGPLILVSRKPKEGYLKLAQDLALDLETLWGLILEIKVTSFDSARALVELVKDVSEYTLKLAYQNAMQQREIAITLELPKLGRLLNSLLDVAFQISGADIGSIMFFDQVKNILTIHSSRGLPDDVVRRTRVTPGYGIAGLAVQEGKSFLIDDKTDDNRIRPYLNRPDIRSSMVFPLRAQNRIVGVMNLGALRSSAQRFDYNSLNMMNKLVDLVSQAMTR